MATHPVTHPIVEIAVPCPLRRSFDYLWPEDCPQPPVAGQRVEIPFGNRHLVGIVLSEKSASDINTAKLKAVIQPLDAEPSLSEAQLKLGQWAAKYYHHPIGDCLQQMLPVSLRKTGNSEPREQAVSCWRLHPDWQQHLPSSRAHQQHALLEAFATAPEHTLSMKQVNTLGFSRPLLRELLKRELLIPAPALAPATLSPESPPELNAEQASAVAAVRDSLGQFRRFLLDGITGSGKTEVYLQLIAHCLQAGRQALVLVPEIGLTPQTLQRFERRFPGQIASLHSGLSDSERLRSWQAARSGERAVLLGTRSAVLAELPKLGLIIVDEEHDPSYKQQDGWRYSARDIAVKRAADLSCPVLLASATPSLDSLFNVKQQRYHLLKLQQRAGSAKPPSVRLVDIRHQSLHEGLSDTLLSRIDRTLNAGQQALVFLNRRGFAPTLQCHSCGWIAHCNACDARMTVHFRRRELRCHHCDARAPLPPKCPDCGDSHWLFDGPGTERLELALKSRFADTTIHRIDRDTTRGQGDIQRVVNAIKDGQPSILIGTQMLAKGHHFPNVTLVGIVDMDAGLFSADFRAVERCGQLLMQVAGRAGRAELPGEVLIQTHCPEHPALLSLIHQGYGAFAQQQLQERETLGLPPFAHSAVIRSDAVKLQVAEDFLEQLRQRLYLEHPDWQQIGPLPAPMARRAGRYRCSLILQSPNRVLLHRQLGLAAHYGEQLKKTGGLRWSIDVDPIELF